LTAGMAFADRQRLADDVPRLGFAAMAGKHTVGTLSKELVKIGRSIDVDYESSQGRCHAATHGVDSQQRGCPNSFFNAVATSSRNDWGN
jgi:hypothetical protein